MRPFYIYKAKNSVFYVQFTSEQTKKRLSALSTHQRNYNDALKIACNWLQNGIPSREGKRPVETVAAVQAFVSLVEGGELGKAECERVLKAFAHKGYVISAEKTVEKTAEKTAETNLEKSKNNKPTATEPGKIGLVSFLEDFWNYDTSPYVQDKVIHKQRIGKQHCYISKKRVAHWEEYFDREKLLDEVTTGDIKAFELFLAKKNFTTATLNQLVLVGKTAFKWAVANKKLAENPCLGLTRYGKETQERGVLTQEEARTIFQVQWRDERARVASLIAMTTGMRMGEILALRVSDIGENRLFVRHSWSVFDGLKKPKNEKEREVPLIPSVKIALLKLARSNPFGWDPDQFIFYGTLKNSPVVNNVLSEGFKDALYKSGISEELRVERNIVFHSWRHYYAKVISDRVGQRQAQLALGHLTASMTAHYADHKTEEDLSAIEQAVGEAFKECIPMF